MLQTSMLFPSGPTCQSCRKPINTASLEVQLDRQIRDHIGRYYESWTVCDDQTCGNRTRMMGVYGRRCLKAGRRGRVMFEVCFVSASGVPQRLIPLQYSDAQLYTQLRYYSHLFDVDKAIRSAASGKRQGMLVRAPASPTDSDALGRRYHGLGEFTE